MKYFILCYTSIHDFFFFFYSKSFSFYAFSYAKPGRFDRQELEAVIKKCNFSNWMFLLFLASNLSEFLFKKVIYHLSDEFTPSVLKDNEINAAMEPTAPGPSHYPNLPLDQVDAPLISKVAYIEESEKTK